MNGKFMICHDLFISCMLQQFLLLYNCTMGSISLIIVCTSLESRRYSYLKATTANFWLGTVATTSVACNCCCLLLFCKIQAMPRSLRPCQSWWPWTFLLAGRQKLSFTCCSEQEIGDVGNFSPFLVHINSFPIKGGRLYLNFR